MSLTDLELEALEMMSVIVKNRDTLVCDLDAPSLAGLNEHLVDLLGKSGQKLGQKGHPPHVTDRADSVTAERYREKALHFGTGCHWPTVTEGTEAGT